jgi:hypothetical protein
VRFQNGKVIHRRRVIAIVRQQESFAMKNHGLLVAAVVLIVVGCSSNDSKPPPENPKMPPQTAFDIARCYRYFLPKDYLQHQPDDGRGLVRPFGHGLFVLLVQDQDGLVKNVTPGDLAGAKLTAESAHDRALDNLQKLFASGKIKPMKYDKGPHDRPFILVNEHWASAACILLPKVRSFAQKNLGQDDIVASIPHRDAMLLFPKPANGEFGEIRKFVVEHESEGRKPLTFELFELTEKGPVPVLKAP